MERIVETFIDLAKIYSPTGKEEEIAQDCINRLKKLGISPVRHSGFACYDANVFAEMGIKIINLANGGENGHSVRERISIKNLKDTSNLVYALATSRV